jgi:DNA-binding GntR family transcriptional regulator
MGTAKTKSSKKERGLPAGERVEAHLRKAIYAGTLRPRQRIIEEDLARELKVSRGPVREALLRLERDGLVTTTSRRGTFIRDISLTEIGVIFRMRAKLEGLCARYMREDASVDPANLLEPVLKRLKAAAEKNSEERFFHADMELHRTIWKAANQPLLYVTLNLVMNPYIFMIARTYSTQVAIRSRFEHHERYVKMLLKTPIARIEEEVERYFSAMYTQTFDRISPFPALGLHGWSGDSDNGGTTRKSRLRQT